MQRNKRLALFVMGMVGVAVVVGGINVWKVYGSPDPKPNDYVWSMLSSIPTTPLSPLRMNPGDPLRGHQFVDLNGDGLVDFVYKDTTVGGEQVQVGVYMNKGNFSFEQRYYCQADVVNRQFSGDCGQ